jgi:hypothetical protein
VFSTSDGLSWGGTIAWESGSVLDGCLLGEKALGSECLVGHLMLAAKTAIFWLAAWL